MQYKRFQKLRHCCYWSSCRAVTRRDNWGGVCIFIYSCSALLISVKSDSFYGMWKWIYEYETPDPPPPPPYRVDLVFVTQLDLHTLLSLAFWELINVLYIVRCWFIWWLCFVLGDCLITAATGNLGDVVAERAGLVPTHAYAVLDIRKIQVLFRWMCWLIMKIINNRQ